MKVTASHTMKPVFIFPHTYGEFPHTDFGIGISPLQILGLGFPLADLRDFWGEIWKGNFPSRDWSSGEEISDQNRSQNDENLIE